MAQAHVANLKRLAPDVTMFDVAVNVVFKGRILFWYVHKVVFPSTVVWKLDIIHANTWNMRCAVQTANQSPPQKKELDIKEFH